MANSIASLEVLMKAFAESSTHLLDASILPLGWNPVTLPKKLRIGIMRHNGIVKAHPPMIRAIDEVAHKLEAAGHEGKAVSNL